MSYLQCQGFDFRSGAERRRMRVFADQEGRAVGLSEPMLRTNNLPTRRPRTRLTLRAPATLSPFGVIRG